MIDIRRCSSDELNAINQRAALWKSRLQNVKLPDDSHSGDQRILERRSNVLDRGLQWRDADLPFEKAS